MHDRLYNLSAGPAVLPEVVLEKVRDNLLNFEGCGVGIVELSHRSPEFEAVMKRAEDRLRSLLAIPEQYSVLFLQGGATLQFSMVPLNLINDAKPADYILSGSWAEKAHEEASKFGKTQVAATSKDRAYCYIPEELKLSINPAYLHFTSNNTIVGTQFQTEPNVSGIPLVCDASSDLLHKKIDVTKYGLIYAGAQKNVGPAGLTIVIIDKALLERSRPDLPVYLNYNTHHKAKSLYNTPTTFAIYVASEVFSWLIAQGGLSAIEQLNQNKAKILYDTIDASDFWQGFADANSRSLMNITFRIKDHSLEPKFLAYAEEQGFKQLEGHRSVGGLRASIYNAFPVEGVQTLSELMKEFERKNG